MNTLTYISSLFSTRAPIPNAEPTASTSNLPPPTPTQDVDSESEQQQQLDLSHPSLQAQLDQLSQSSPEASTIYLSARRSSRPGERPTISVSVTPSSEVLRKAAERGTVLPGYSRTIYSSSSTGFTSRAEDVPLPDSPVGEGYDLSEWEGGDEAYHEKDKEVVISRTKTEEDAQEDKEGERRLKLRELERMELGRAWPVRIGVSIYVFLRHLLSFLGFTYPRIRTPALLHTTSTTTPAISFPTPPTTIDEDPSESISDKASLTSSLPLVPPPPPLTRSSTPTLNFFLRKGTPPSPTPSSVASSQILPPKPPRLTPKTLVLDLDETLIHSTSRPYTNSRNGLKVRIVEVVLDGRSTVYTVYKRPWVDFFLRKVSTWYTVIIFTASLPEYADPVIDWLDGGDGGGGMVGGRLFRSDCLQTNGAYVKDLSVVDADLSKVCLVDNSPASYAINQANGIPIEGWINDPNDECLLDLLPMLDSLRFTSDVRRVLGLRGFGKS